ncbi:uncharacterized protein LOC135398452 [Ornithodoros turicata]|uniref:uncharacterized protein LOC135398452 n=1 Tax=Ornithodoros turicata TaxID=34597 RepID=UPI003138E20B
MLSLFFEYPFSVALVEEVRKNIMFPAATVCVSRWINITRLCNVFRSTCGPVEQEDHSGPWEFLLRDVASRGLIAHLPDELFKCYMRSTVASCMSFSCNSMTKITYYRSPAQMCYTIDSYQWTDFSHPVRRCASPWNYELSLRSQWDSNLTLALREVEVMPLVIHQPLTCPPDKLSSIMIEPGMSYTISVSQRKVVRLPPPYKSMCTDYVSLGMRKEYFGYLTRDVS